MKIKTGKFLSVVSFFLWILFLMPREAAAEKSVVVTILPLADFVRNIGGDKVHVSVMIPPGGNPHTYEPTPGQMRTVSEAVLYVKVGTEMEFEMTWMGKLTALNKKMSVCDASKGIELLGVKEPFDHAEGGDHRHHHHGGEDPHTWLSPLNAIMIAGNIRDALIGTDPENRDQYENNAREYIIKLNKLDSYIRDKLKHSSGRAFIVFHPAWGYFAADYGLREMPVEYSSKDPTPRQMAELITEARKLNIKVIFVSPQFSTRSAEAIARNINGRVEFIDPLAGDYIENLKKVADILADAE
ncbi:MAG: zinc ABC transporter substrate-binding protein [Candidatus Omnitrophota bacterium]